MCRKEGRRCEHFWSGTQRNIYNAKRRVIRNGERTAKAEENNNPEKAKYYKSLMLKAEEEVKEYNEILTQEKEERYQNALKDTKEKQEALNDPKPTGMSS